MPAGGEQNITFPGDPDPAVEVRQAILVRARDARVKAAGPGIAGAIAWSRDDWDAYILNAAVAEHVEREAAARVLRDETVAQAQGALEFVAERYRRGGSGANFRSDRCTGISSDALAWYGVGCTPEPKRHQYPADASDLAACERTFAMAPEHVQKRMLPVMEKYRSALTETPEASGE